MTTAVRLEVLGAVLVCLMAGCWLLLRKLEHQQRIGARLRYVRQEEQSGGRRESPAPAAGLSLRMVAGLGNVVARSGLLPAKTLAELEQTLVSGGIRTANGLSVFVGGKILLLVGLPTLAIFALRLVHLSPMMRMGAIGGAAVAGLLLPDLIVGRLRKAYLRRVQAGLPDALDMLVICSEAGLGLEPAIERVAQEIRGAHVAVADELKITASELRIATDRRVALAGMGTRTGLADLKRLGATLVQTMQFGTPLSQALRTLSAEMREEVLTKFEERAARLPVLLTLPMIVFILPCIFMVVGGPAALILTRTFSSNH